MRFSIVIPVYNVEKYLRECVDSILNQSFKDFELILVDDGSQDSSPAICGSYAKADKRVKALYKDNGGVMETWLLGITSASGDYVISIDSDDYVSSDLLEKCSYIIDNYNPKMLVFGYETFSVAGTTLNMLGVKGGLYNEEGKEKYILPTLINKGCFENRSCLYLSRINKVIDRKVLLSNLDCYHKGFYYGEDNLCAIPNVLDCSSIYVFENYYPYKYRTNANSLTHSYHRGLWKQFEQLNLLTLQVLEKKGYTHLSEQVYCDSVFHAAVAINNAMASGDSGREIRKEMKSITNSDYVRKGIRLMDKKLCTIKQRINLFLIKHRAVCFLYLIKKLTMA